MQGKTNHISKGGKIRILLVTLLALASLVTQPPELGPAESRICFIFVPEEDRCERAVSPKSKLFGF